MDRHGSMTTDVGREYIAYCRRRLLKEYFPKIERCVNELSEDDMWWRTHETDNRIVNLLLHLSGNIRQWIISGLGDTPDKRDRAKEFSEREGIPKTVLLKNLEATLREADSVLANFDTSRLLEVRHFQVFDVTCLDALSHVV